jgi:hypothetical protein
MQKAYKLAVETSGAKSRQAITPSGVKLLHEIVLV